jgi:hypothetical protein
MFLDSKREENSQEATDSVSKTMCSLVFGMLDDGQSPKTPINL